jgi:hypothetical protein
MTRAEMRVGLDQMPTWALEQKAAANRQVIDLMRRRLAAGEEVARMYQEPGLAWLERQADVAETLVAERRAPERQSGCVRDAGCVRWVETGPLEGSHAFQEVQSHLVPPLGRTLRVSRVQNAGVAPSHL